MAAPDISSLVPEPWKKLKPFLVRADEFKAKQPAVSYHLKTYVANEAMKLRSKDDPKPLQQAGTKFLMALMDQCEKEKTELGDELRKTDGRTILTKTGLMLFSKADDLERTGTANEAVVKLFFASAQLLEATAQFTPDGQLDPIAAEKVKYAKFIVFKMKKALDSGQPYVSPNELEAPAEATSPEVAPPAPDIAPGKGFSYVAPPAAPPPPPPLPYPGVSQPLPQQPVFNRAGSEQLGDAPHGFPQIPPTYTPSAPPVAAAAAPAPPPAAPRHPQPSHPQPQPQPAAAAQYRPPPSAPAAPPPAPSNGHEPSMDAIVAAQKYAKQAVAALQFFDSGNARQQLLMALQALDSS